MEKLSISDLHIILVEPSDTQRKIITTLLLKEKVREIDPVSTLSEAMSAVKAHGADLIVSAMTNLNLFHSCWYQVRTD